MIVYTPQGAEGYEWALPVDAQDHRIFRRLRGQRMAGQWHPVRMYLLHEDEGQVFRHADIPSLGSSALLALTRRAMDALGELLAADCEFLPLACDEEDLWLVNPVLLPGAFDGQRSELKRFASSGRIMNVSRYAFHGEVVAGHRCFRIPEQPPTFVTDDVVDAVQAAGLRGVRFVPVWRSS
jgi:hypothetical protein